MRIYLIGIAGSAMGNLAVLLAKAGHEVRGSDLRAYPPISDLLRDHGIAVDEGFGPEGPAVFGAEVVVIGNAVSRGNPQVEAVLRRRDLPLLSMPEAVNRFVAGPRHRIVIAGTHGKTTTAAMTAWLLREAGLDPGFLIGGVVPDLGGGAAFGAPEAPVVLEGDEYDSAFFDKRSKFIHYRPDVLVLNNLEFDHGDIFRDLVDVVRTFRHLLATVAPEGTVFYNGDDPNLAMVGEVTWCRTVSVGFGTSNQQQIRPGDGFPILEGGGGEHRLHPPRPGAHTLRNVAMATLAAQEFAEPVEGNLQGFCGVRRRLELLAATGAVRIYEDFGHHPSAIAATLEELRLELPDWRIWAAFEPRSNTSRTRVFESGFAEAFSSVERFFLGPVHRVEKLGVDERLDAGRLLEKLRESGVAAEGFPHNENLGRAVEAALFRTTAEESPVAVVFFSNGSFDGVHHRLAGLLSTL